MLYLKFTVGSQSVYHNFTWCLMKNTPLHDTLHETHNYCKRNSISKLVTFFMIFIARENGV